MTRRDFELIAATVCYSTVITDEQREKVAAEFAVILRSTNPRFDRERFIRAATDKTYNC